MRKLTQRVLCALLAVCAGSMAIAEPPTKPAEKPKAPDAAKEPGKEPGKERAKEAGKEGIEIEGPVVLKVVPSSMSISGNVSFNENGVVNSQSNYFNMSFYLQAPGNLPIRSVRNIKVTKMITDSGEDLATSMQSQNNESFQVPEDLFTAPGQDRNRGRGRRQTGINPPFPKKGCRKIVKMQGTVEVDIASGPLKRVTVGKIADVEGKRIKIEGLDDAWVQFSQVDDGNQKRVQVTSTGGTFAKFARLYFFTPQGTLVQNQGYGTSYSGRGDGPVTLMLYGQFPEGTTAVILVYSNSKTVSATFEGTDIQMPQIFTEGNDTFDMVMKAEPIEDGFALADIAPKVEKVEGDKAAAAPKPAAKPAMAPTALPVVIAAVPSDIKTLEEMKFTKEDAPADPAKEAREKRRLEMLKAKEKAVADKAAAAAAAEKAKAEAAALEEKAKAIEDPKAGAPKNNATTQPK